MTLVTCENLSVQYDSQTALKDVNFTVEQGDYVCVVGENGTGKSTLMKVILGLLRPSAGTIRYDGIRPAQIGYLPQQTVVQRDFPASVREVVLSGRLNRKGLLPFYSAEDRRAAQLNMQRLDIAALAGKSYRELSGGQQQRVLLARALCATDKLLVLDEPVTGLDPVVTGGLYALIRSLNRDAGITVLMVSHDIHAAVQNANKILHLDVEVQYFGPTDGYIHTDLGRTMLGGCPVCLH